MSTDSPLSSEEVDSRPITASMLFKSCTIGDIWTKDKSIISIRGDLPLKETLGKLEREGILSMPVTVDGKIIGIVDVQSIVLFLVGIYPKNVEKIETLTREDLKTIIETGKKFEATPTMEVLDLMEAYASGQPLYYPVKNTTTIPELAEYFYLGVHRCPVLSKDSTRFVNTISQTDLLRVLAHTLPSMPVLAKRQLSDLDISISHKMNSVTKDETVLKALFTLNSNHISAVPIVDEENHVVGTFSSTNCLALSRYNFTEVVAPVWEFINNAAEREYGLTFMSRIHRRKAITPITCKPSDTIESIVLKMLGYHIHRLWVVDEEEKLLGVVALGDIVKVFLTW